MELFACGVQERSLLVNSWGWNRMQLNQYPEFPFGF
jgi:hypothetical protein